MKQFVRLPSPAILSLILASLVVVPQLTAVPSQVPCKDCANSVTLPPSVSRTIKKNFPNLLATSYLTATLSGVPVGYSLQNIAYTAWCVDAPSTPVFASDLTVTPYSTYSPTAIAYSNVFDKINYLLNHKGLGTYFDVQGNIWRLLGYTPNALQFPVTPLSTLMLADANANGTGYVPGPGETLAILLKEDGPGGETQDSIIEIPAPDCGYIGDYVWQDTDKNGLQNVGEPGINGVTVVLKDALGNVLNTAVTANAPAGHGYLPPGTAGYYQFCGLKAGTFQVSIDNSQGALTGFTPTTVQAGGGANPASDSNPNAATVVLPNDNSVDETIDFGYWPVLPMQVSCAPTAGQTGSSASYFISVTGGVPSYMFTLAAGSLPAGLNLNGTTGEIYGTPTGFGTTGFSVQVRDSSTLTSGGQTTSCSLTINPPPISVQCAPGMTGQVGLPYSSTVVASGGTGIYTFSVVGTIPPGLSLEPTTGVISGIPTTYGTFSYGVKVTDSQGNSATSPSLCTLEVAPAPINVICAPATTGQVGVGYSSMATATGGTGGYIFSIVGGSLPAGLTMNSAGLISGTPLPGSHGTASITIKVTDSQGNTATTTSNCTIVIAPAPLTVICAPTTTGQVGVPYSSMVTASGGVGPYTFMIVSGALPSGLTMNAAGLISGTPAVGSHGTASFTVKMTDSQGNTATTTSNCTLVIAPAPLTVLCAPITTGQVGVAYSSMVTASGGVGPYRFTIVGGALPSGLSLDLNSGLISGTLAVGSHGTASFTVKVTDSLGNTANTTSNCTLVIAPKPLTVICAPSTTGQKGVPYSSTAVATGGTGGYVFSIVGGALPAGLGLNASSGLISGTPTVYGTFSFTIQVKDSAGTTATTGGTACTLVIAPPTAPPISLECGTCGASKGTIGTPYSAKLTVTGGLAPFTFSMAVGSTLPPGLTLNATTGVISGTPTTAGTYIFTTVVTDAAGQSDTATCTIVVKPPPIYLDCGTCGANRATAGTPYTVQLKVTGGTAPFTFSVVYGSMPAGLTLNTTTGAITGTPTTAGTYSFITKVVDANGSVDTTYCTIYVISSPVDLQCGACGGSKGTVGSAFSEKLMASGGTAAYTYSIFSGSLPPGLTLNATTGVISGTPTTAGTYTFTSKAVDSKGNSDTVTCTITVAYSPVNLECGACNTTSAKVGTAYSAMMAVSGGKASYTYSITSGSLPPGLSLSSSTGKITGTPTGAGSYTFTAKVVDANGSSDTVTCFIVVAGSSLNLDCGTCGSPKGTVGESYAAMFSVTGGTGPYTFTLSYGSLPPGLSLDKYTGKITGTPTTAGTYNFTAKVTDKNGNSDPASCSLIVVSSPLNLECGSCGTASPAAGSSYSSTLAVTGGYPGYTFSIYLGSLPAGLTLNTSTGVISGTPTTPGTYTFTAKVKDSHGNYDTTICTITVINPALDLQCGSCGASKATDGKAYTSSFSVSGGTAPYTYSIISGSLPPGLTRNGNTVSGTPTTAGTYTFTTKVTDSKGKTDTATCTLVVLPSPVDLQCGSCGADKAKVGVSYSSTPQINGGVAPYSYSLVSGTLPPGLSLSMSTGKVSGTPTAASTYTFTIKATDSKGTTDTATCTIVVVSNVSCGDFITYTQGGWGANPSGNNPGTLLANNFSKVYPGGSVSIGGTKKLTFTGAAAIAAFLPAGGTGAVLTSSATNPTSSGAGVLAGQVLALQLNVDFSNKGILSGGLANLKVGSGDLQGQTVAQVLALANAVLGGNTAALPAGVSISDLVTVVDNINNNFDNGNENNGFLQ